MKKTSGIFSFISAIFFLIGSIYYFCILYMCAKHSIGKIEMVKANDGSSEFYTRFSLSNINSVTIACALVFLALLAMLVLLAIFTFKKKLSILSIIFPIATIVVQVTLKANTLLSEVMFVRYTLNIDTRGDFMFFVLENIKYLPFLLALVSGLVYFVLSMYLQKNKPCEEISAELLTEE